METQWISVDDRENQVPNEILDGEILLLFENGSIRRYEEEWPEEFGLNGIITHWRLITNQI